MKFRAYFLAATFILSGCVALRAGAQASASKEVRGPDWVDISATISESPQVLQSIEVKAPAAGNITVMVTGTMTYYHTKGTGGYYCLQLSETSGYVGGCLPNGVDSAIRGAVAAGEVTSSLTDGTSVPYSIVKTYPVKAGVNYTFYLNGYAGALGNSMLFQPAMTAIFVPGTLLP